MTPLLTAGVGSISVTPPAEEGMADDSTKDGGNKFAGGDSILVHDYVAVLDQVDQVIAEIDKKPLQVAIEAMILRVTLDDKYNFGVDFALLRNHLLFATGTPLANLSDFDISAGGLQFAYLDGSTGAFVQALETIGDTDVVASPKVMVVDKARAEILIGQQLGYVNTTITETSTAQNVQFLEVGAQLRLRPFISSDGLVRMEVHPELSTGEVKVEQGLTLPDKDVTQVTTNIMVPRRLHRDHRRVDAARFEHDRPAGAVFRLAAGHWIFVPHEDRNDEEARNYRAAYAAHCVRAGCVLRRRQGRGGILSSPGGVRRSDEPAEQTVLGPQVLPIGANGVGQGRSGNSDADDRSGDSFRSGKPSGDRFAHRYCERSAGG